MTFVEVRSIFTCNHDSDMPALSSKPPNSSDEFRRPDNDLYANLSCGRSPVYCLWLLPCESDANRLAGQIRQLAGDAPSDSPSPLFDPHITFLPGLDLGIDLETLKSTVQRALTEWTHSSGLTDGLGLNLEKPINEGTFYTAIIHPVEQDLPPTGEVGGTPYAQLLQGRSIVQARLNETFHLPPPVPPHKPYFPHLSLCYSSLAKQGLERTTKSFIKKTKEDGELVGYVKLDRCALMRLKGEVEDWKTVVVYDLSGRVVSG
jgi:hypothetical protein